VHQLEVRFQLVEKIDIPGFGGLPGATSALGAPAPTTGEVQFALIPADVGPPMFERLGFCPRRWRGTSTFKLSMFCSRPKYVSGRFGASEIG
jgi:hypothetical protein